MFIIVTSNYITCVGRVCDAWQARLVVSKAAVATEAAKAAFVRTMDHYRYDETYAHAGHTLLERGRRCLQQQGVTLATGANVLDAGEPIHWRPRRSSAQIGGSEEPVVLWSSIPTRGECGEGMGPV